MKTFNASDLTHKRAQVMKAAREVGAIIQEKRTNGEVIQEFILISKDNLNDMECDYNIDRFVGLSELINGGE